MDKRAVLTSVIKRTSFFSDLLLNPDFQRFREEVAEKKMHRYLDAAKSADLMSEEGRALALTNLARYQDLKAIFEDIFTNSAIAEESARKQLRNL